jgi:hypothetical protein
MLFWLSFLASLFGPANALEIAKILAPAADAPQYRRASKGISTIFGYKGDRYGSGATRCLRDELGRKRPVDPERDIGIAHRELDCGAVVHLTNMETGKTVRAVVIDAGPWGAMSKNPATGERFWYIKRHREDRPGKADCPAQNCPVGKWRGIADLTPKAAELLDHDGWARIKLVYDKRDLRSYKRLEKARQQQRDRRNQT